MRERIEETTVGYVPGVSVGVGNILVREYEDEQGEPRRGPTAILALRPDDQSLPESTLLVHQGMKVQIGEGCYLVEELSLESDGSENGWVVLKGVEPDLS